MFKKQTGFQEKLNCHVEMNHRVFGVLFQFLHRSLQEIDGVENQTVKKSPSRVCNLMR